MAGTVPFDQGRMDAKTVGAVDVMRFEIGRGSASLQVAKSRNNIRHHVTRPRQPEAWLAWLIRHFKVEAYQNYPGARSGAAPPEALRSLGLE